MEADANPPTPESAAASAGPRRGPSRWVGLGFVLLLMGVYVASQYLSQSGPIIHWLQDFNEALAVAKAENKRIFLLLHEAGCPITAGLDRGLFQQHFARERLSKMICCRVVVKPGDELASRFDFRRDPMMFVLGPTGELLGPPLKGRVEEREFTTYVQPVPRQGG